MEKIPKEVHVYVGSPRKREKGIIIAGQLVELLD
jgi:hypothetical protein